MGERAERIAEELGIRPDQVRAVASLLEEGATIPFIARYRKERTGSLDEVAIASVRDRLRQLAALEDRRAAILESLAERGLLAPNLETAILAAETMTALEDLYLPHRPRRRTRAAIARERGLEPLADRLLDPDPALDPAGEAVAFLDPEAGVETIDDALAGARDILAERFSESAEARAELRALFAQRGVLRARAIDEDRDGAATYRDYFDWEEPAKDAPAHRIHALLRGEREGVLRVSIRPDEAAALAYLRRTFVPGEGAASDHLSRAVEDAYKRLLAPSLETELRATLKEKADRAAARVFAANLRELLMAPPLGGRRVLAIDPGYRTGGKVVCLDPQGRLLTDTVVQITASAQERTAAAAVIRDLVRAHEIEAIAIGNGTASRETEAFVRGLGLPASIPIVLVNESGASVYSASEVARRELPDHDITVRGAVSIGRRLIDPLAELVKIDPQAIGVGQYQHDVDGALLARTLDDLVERCVNAVGVDVNTASAPLLARVSGIGPKLAEQIVSYRESHGPFRSRRELLDVPRLGPKAFEQAAGFLRIRGGEEPLDGTAVHPESYPIVRRIARDLGRTVADLIGDPTLPDQVDLDRYVTDAVGRPTLLDILEELARPGRDPRDAFEPFAFSEDVREIGDLKPGMRLPGIVTNVVAFGAFVDVGVHQDGLVHVSQLADRFVADPATIVRTGQRVTVTVIDVDVARRRIALSMRTRPGDRGSNRRGGDRTSPGGSGGRGGS